MKWRIGAVALFLAAAAITVRSVGHGEPVELDRPLSEFPVVVADWQGRDFRLGERLEAKLGVTSYLYRTYTRNSRDVLHLYVGFYDSQKHGDMIHSPKNCLPGNGWYISSKDKTTLAISPYAPFAVNKFLVENGSERQLVLYWYQQSGGRVVTNEYVGRVLLVLDAFTKKRTDAVLIRVSIPVLQSVEASHERAVEFLRAGYPILMTFLPGERPTEPLPSVSGPSS